MCCTVAGLTVEASQHLTLMWTWAAAVHICMYNIQLLKGGERELWRGGRSPPWPYVEKTLPTFTPWCYWQARSYRALLIYLARDFIVYQSGIIFIMPYKVIHTYCCYVTSLSFTVTRVLYALVTFASNVTNFLVPNTSAIEEANTSPPTIASLYSTSSSDVTDRIAEPRG